jgi:hypothetical protein
MTSNHTETVFQQDGDVLRRGGGGDGQAQPGGARFDQQALDPGPHGNAASGGQRGVVPGLGLVKFRHEFVEIGRLAIVRPVVVDIVLHPLLAAGDGEQFAVQGNIPVPVQTGLLKGLIEGGTVTVTLGIGKGAVDVE